MLENGKIMVVVVVLALILVSIFVYLFTIDRKVTKLEKEVKEKISEHEK
jgi:CcmD family protein